MSLVLSLLHQVSLCHLLFIVVEGNWGHESASLVLSLFVSVIILCWLFHPDITVVVDRA